MIDSICAQTERQYQTTDEVLSAVNRKEVDIGLLDAFAATSLQKKIARSSLKVKAVINANTGFGVVLSNELVRLEGDFRSYIASNKALISGFIANMTKQLNVSAIELAIQSPYSIHSSDSMLCLD